jgi:hypothetical protein
MPMSVMKRLKEIKEMRYAYFSCFHFFANVKHRERSMQRGPKKPIPLTKMKVHPTHPL